MTRRVTDKQAVDMWSLPATAETCNLIADRAEADELLRRVLAKAAEPGPLGMWKDVCADIRAWLDAAKGET